MLCYRKHWAWTRVRTYTAQERNTLIGAFLETLLVQYKVSVSTVSSSFLVKVFLKFQPCKESKNTHLSEASFKAFHYSEKFQNLSEEEKKKFTNILRCHFCNQCLSFISQRHKPMTPHNRPFALWRNLLPIPESLAHFLLFSSFAPILLWSYYS